MKVHEVLTILREDGWTVTRTRGSHHILKHGLKKGIVVVPGHLSDEMAPGTLKSIWNQARIEKRP